MKNKWVMMIAGLLVIIAAIFFFTSVRNKSTEQPILPGLTSPSATPETETSDQFIPTEVDISQLQAGGSSYADPAGVYSVLYPNDFTLDTQNNGQYTRVFKPGPTQRGQTEMYDGVIVHFESIDLQGKSLSDFIDTRIQEATADGTTQTVQTKKAVVLGVYPGFTYVQRGLGEFTHLVVQRDATSNHAADITFMVNDPTNQGFQDQVHQILSTLTLLK